MARSSDVQRVLDRIEHDLSPEVLRSKVELPFQEARESFEPRFLTTDDWDEIRAEMVRFVRHVDGRRYFGDAAKIPEHIGKIALGDFYLLHPSLERQLEDIVGRGERGGMRHALDVVTRVMQEDRLKAHLNQGVGLEIHGLSPRDRHELTLAYFEAYPSMPYLEPDMPVIIMDKWPEMLQKHARFVLGWNQPN